MAKRFVNPRISESLKSETFFFFPTEIFAMNLRLSYCIIYSHLKCDFGSKSTYSAKCQDYH